MRRGEKMENKSAKGIVNASALVRCVLTPEGMASDEAPARIETSGAQTGLQALKSFLVISFATNPPGTVWSLCE